MTTTAPEPAGDVGRAGGGGGPRDAGPRAGGVSPAGGVAHTRRAAEQQWLWALLPAFPLTLLVVRLWYLGRQDTATILLLTQFVSPLGLISVLFLSAVWMFPLMVLAARYLGLVSLAGVPRRPWPWVVRLGVRMPRWVVALAVVLGAVLWQLRFLPALAMLAIAVAGLQVRAADPPSPRRRELVCTLLPVAAAALVYVALGPATWRAFVGGDWSTAVLLGLPPLLTPLLTGPLPRRAVLPAVRLAVALGVVATPLIIAVIFVRSPVLPTVAVEVEPGAAAAAGAPLQVLRGQVITADDAFVTLLDERGQVEFVPVARVRSQVLCPEYREPPFSDARALGWHLEEPALEWLAPRPEPEVRDPRCQGRPLAPPMPAAAGDRGP